jgi:hypothetical protein
MKVIAKFAALSLIAASLTACGEKSLVSVNINTPSASVVAAAPDNNKDDVATVKAAIFQHDPTGDLRRDLKQMAAANKISEAEMLAGCAGIVSAEQRVAVANGMQDLAEFEQNVVNLGIEMAVKRGLDRSYVVGAVNGAEASINEKVANNGDRAALVKMVRGCVAVILEAAL